MHTFKEYADLVKKEHALNKTIAPNETGTTASKAYAVGDHFIRNGILYKVTTAIASGATWANISSSYTTEKDISSSIQNLSTHNNVNGSKNLLPLNPPLGTYYGITVAKSSNYWTADGTASASPTAFSLLSPVFDTIPNCKVAIENTGIDMSKTYRFSRQAKVSGLRYNFRLYNGSTLLLESTLNDSNNLYLDIDMSQYPTTTHIAMGLEITNGTVLSLSAIKPMLSLVSDYDLDNSWTPWAENNYVLTRDKVGMDLLSEVGAVNHLENKSTTFVSSASGLTFTVNTDKSITVSATSGSYPFTVLANSSLIINSDSCDNLKEGATYKLSGCPSGGSSSSYYIAFFQSGVVDKSDKGDGYIFTKTASMTNVLAQITFKKNAVLSSAITFKPMIAPVDYTGPYVPYAKTNKELTDLWNTNKYAEYDVTGGETTWFDFTNATRKLLVNTFTRHCLLIIQNVTTLATFSVGMVRGIASLPHDNLYKPPYNVYGVGRVIKDGTLYNKVVFSKNSINNAIAMVSYESIPSGAEIFFNIEWMY